jgi:hypothetical protein
MHAIHVYDSPGAVTSIGEALRTEGEEEARGPALWTLTIRGHELLGRYTLVDSRFLPAPGMNSGLESSRDTAILERPLADTSTRPSRAAAYPTADGVSSRDEPHGRRPCYADTGPAHGCLLLKGADRQIGVMNHPNDARPIGKALCVGQTATGVALWKLCVRDVWLPERCIVVDRQFRAAKC